MPDLRRYTFLAIVLLIILRMAIGWQLYYEGYWKFKSQKTAAPWSAEGYLKNAQGPMRETFRNMTGDPDDLKWLDYQSIEKRIEGWQSDFAFHYKLDEKQKKELEEMVQGPEQYTSSLEELPQGITPEKLSAFMEGSVEFDGESEQLVSSGEMHVAPEDYQRLNNSLKKQIEKLIEKRNEYRTKKEDELTGEDKKTIAEIKAKGLPLVRLQKALTEIYEESNNLPFLKKVRKHLHADTENFSWTRTDDEGNPLERENGLPIYERLGDIEKYKSLVKRYNENVPQAKQNFQFDHLNYDQSTIRSLKKKLIDPIKQWESDLKKKARLILNETQRKMVSLSEPANQIQAINRATMWGLMILGVLLLIGFFSRLAAFGAAVLILSFYLAMPPLPGVPELPGPEHSFIVNKNLIEVFALLVLTVIPTGQWFGMDGLIGWFFQRRADRKPPTVAETRLDKHARKKS